MPIVISTLSKNLSQFDVSLEEEYFKPLMYMYTLLLILLDIP